jgi:uncharacterized protein with FMN-binding domain
MKKGIQIILIVVALAGVAFFLRFTKYQYDIKHIEVKPVAFSEVEDGTHHRKFDLFLVKAEITAEMEDGKLIEFTLDEHVNGRGELAEPIIQRVLEEQSMEVDTVSGATASSKAILKALEDALNS